MENQLLNYQKEVLERNKGKKVEWYSPFGISEGYIQDLRYMFGNLQWIISKSKNPRSEFNLNNGQWFIVDPLRLTEIQKSK